MPTSFDELDLNALVSRWCSASCLHARLRHATPAEWATAWESLPYQPVGYGGPTIDYQHAYLRGLGWRVIDASLVLLNDGKPCGVWPLTIGGTAEPRLTSLGSGILPPRFGSSVSPRTIKTITRRALDWVAAAQADLDQDDAEFEDPPVPILIPLGVSEWHQQLLGQGAALATSHKLYVDLGPGLADIHRRFRKSYRPLVSLGLRTWKVEVMDSSGPSPSAWDEFRALHRVAAGRVTRSDETWDLLFEMVARGLACLVVLRDGVLGTLVGGGLFQFSRDESVYSVGAYNRDLFDKPLGHVVQARAIEILKARGVRWHLLGEGAFPSDVPPPTAKVRSISAFKSGFASHVFARYMYRVSRQRMPVSRPEQPL